MKIIRKVKRLIKSCSGDKKVYQIQNKLINGLDVMVKDREIKSYGFAIGGDRSCILIHNNDDSYTELKCVLPEKEKL